MLYVYIYIYIRYLCVVAGSSTCLAAKRRLYYLCIQIDRTRGSTHTSYSIRASLWIRSLIAKLAFKVNTTQTPRAHAFLSNVAAPNHLRMNGVVVMAHHWMWKTRAKCCLAESVRMDESKGLKRVAFTLNFRHVRMGCGAREHQCGRVCDLCAENMFECWASSAHIWRIISSHIENQAFPPF